MKLKSRLPLFLALLFILISSCKSSFEVINVNKDSNLEQGILYILPKTKIGISLEVTEIYKQKGPFSEYSHLYFNTKYAIKENSTEFKITDISIKTIPISDLEHIYSIQAGKNSVVSMVNLTPQGFLAGINLSDYQADKVETEQKIISKSIEKDKQPDYGDYSLKSVRETKYDTLYKEVLRDSVIVKIPVISKKDIYKSDKKQAKEIADILFMLRDDRNALLIGENDGDNFPDGEGLKIMLNEINELEKQYMSLFTGREIKIQKKYEYEIIPESDSLEFVFAEFSKLNGIINDLNSKPLILKLYMNQYSEKIFNFSTRITDEFDQKNKAYDGLVHRIPAIIRAEILFDNTLLYSKNIKISQLGSVNIIPGTIFENEVTIEFYPKNGSLKRISKFESN